MPENLETSLLKMRWFQHKNQAVHKLEIIDFYQLNACSRLCLLSINDAYLYLAWFVQDCLLEDEKLEANLLSQLIADLQSKGNLQTAQNGFLKAKIYESLPKNTIELNPLKAGSSNSIFSDNGSIYKLVRRLEEGEHPEEKILYLLRQKDFVPKLQTSFEWHLERKIHTWGLQISKLPAPQTLWDYLLANIHNQATLSQNLQKTGTLLADFHNAVFELLEVEPFKQADQQRVEERILALSKSTQTELGCIKLKPPIANWGYKFKQHGDFHLGQVLEVSGKLYLIDFEGQPVNSLAERWQLNSPLQDLSGLLRSIDYLLTFSQTPANNQKAWQINLEQKFLEAYCSRIVFDLPKPLKPALDLFLLLKALEELDYEQRARPDYAWIPKKAISSLLAV